MLGRNGNIAYVRYDHQGRIVPGGPIISAKPPKVGNWQAVSNVIGTNTTGTNGNVLRAFIRVDYFNRVVPSSLLLLTKEPGDNNSQTTWVEINAQYRGDGRTTTTTTSTTSSTTTTTTTMAPIQLNVYVGGDYNQTCYGPPFVEAHVLTTGPNTTSLCDATILYGDEAFANYMRAFGWFDQNAMAVKMVDSSTLRVGLLSNNETEITFESINLCTNCS